MTAMQLTLDGKEVEHRNVVHRRRLGPNQREIMRQLGFGSLTTTQAGVIVHGLRAERRGYSGCGFGAKDDTRGEYTGTGCCRYAASDGSDLMKTLRELGLVEKHAGLWFAKS